MQKKTLENEVKKAIKKYRKVKFATNDDLYKKGIVDSFDILNIIESLENKFSLKLNFAQDNKFIFSVNHIVKKIKHLEKK